MNFSLSCPEVLKTPMKILMIATTGSCCLFLLSDNAPCVGLVLVLLSQAGETVNSEKENCGFERSHEREA